MPEYITAFKEINITFTPEGIWEFINSMSFPVATVVIGLLVLLAVQGYKIFKSVIYVISAVGLAFVGHAYIAPKLSGFITPHVPESISLDVDVAIAFLLAMVGVLLAHVAYNFMVFCIGGGVGFLVGYFYVAGLLANHFTNLAFLSHKYVVIAVGVVCAIMVAILFLLAFKHLYIIGTSIGCMGLSGLILCKTLMPGEGHVVAAVFIGFAAVIGIFMMRHQYIEEEKTHEFHF